MYTRMHNIASSAKPARTHPRRLVSCANRTKDILYARKIQKYNKISVALRNSVSLRRNEFRVRLCGTPIYIPAANIYTHMVSLYSVYIGTYADVLHIRVDDVYVRYNNTYICVSVRVVGLYHPC